MMKRVIAFVGIFMLCLVVGHGSHATTQYTLFDTGSNICTNNSSLITCPQPGAAYYGQDANYAGVAATFIDNSDKTFRDLNTGLTWEKSNDTNYALHSWQEAHDYCEALSVDGIENWRLPTRRELYAFVYFGQPPNTGPYFLYSSRGYWATLTVAGNGTTAWRVHGTGASGPSPTAPIYKYSVRCVSGTQLSENTYQDNQDGTITDLSTGLMWQKNTDGAARTWQQALDYCENGTFANYTDWRLPNIREVESIVSETLSPTIDPLFYPMWNASGWWSSTPQSAGRIWFMNFQFGTPVHINATAPYRARCVRGQSLYSPARQLSVVIEPSTGGTVTGPGINCNGTPEVSDCQEVYPTGQGVSLTDSPNSGYELDSWFVNGTAQTGTGNSITVTMDTTTTVTVKFRAIQQPGVSINGHWNIWAGDFDQYLDKIVPYKFVREHAWWQDLEPTDFTTENEWSSASWSYQHDENRLTCVLGNNSYQSGYDELVKKFQGAQSPQLLLLLDNFNGSIHNSSGDVTYGQYYDYVLHVVERYDGDGINDMPNLSRPVGYFEVGNEPDCTALSVEDYINNLLKPGYLAAKQANSASVIMNAGLSMECANLRGGSGFDIPYLSAMLDAIENAGGASNNYFMDVLALHYYNNIQNPEGLISNIQSVRTLMSAHGIGDKPIWITEFGVKSSDFGEQGQASILTRYLVLMRALNVANPFVFLLKDDAIDPDTNASSMGIYSISCENGSEALAEKQAAFALQTFSSKVEGLTYQGMTIDNGVYTVTLENSTKTLQIVWSTSTQTITAQLNGHTGVLTNMTGTIIDANLPDQSSVLVDENPRYIEY